MESIYIVISISNESGSYSWYGANYINFALLIFSAGFLFKISAAPFHFWSPVRGLGKSSKFGNLLSNFGNILELLIPSHIWKYIGGWINNSCKVISQKAFLRSALWKPFIKKKAQIFIFEFFLFRTAKKNLFFAAEKNVDYRESKSVLFKTSFRTSNLFEGQNKFVPQTSFSYLKTCFEGQKQVLSHKTSPRWGGGDLSTLPPLHHYVRWREGAGTRLPFFL